MKKVVHVCDVCLKNEPDAKLKYKYRAKALYRAWYGNNWYRIELCDECMEKIIQKVGD